MNWLFRVTHTHCTYMPSVYPSVIRSSILCRNANPSSSVGRSILPKVQYYCSICKTDFQYNFTIFNSSETLMNAIILCLSNWSNANVATLNRAPNHIYRQHFRPVYRYASEMHRWEHSCYETLIGHDSQWPCGILIIRSRKFWDRLLFVERLKYWQFNVNMQLLANSADSKLPPNVHSIAGSLDSSSAFLHFMLRKF